MVEDADKSGEKPEAEIDDDAKDDIISYMRDKFGTEGLSIDDIPGLKGVLNDKEMMNELGEEVSDIFTGFKVLMEDEDLFKEVVKNAYVQQKRSVPPPRGTSFVAKVGDAGRLTIPVANRELLDLEEGDLVDVIISRAEDGR